MMKSWGNNLIAIVLTFVVAATVGSLLRKSQDNNRIKIERAITFTGNTALERGYACGAARRDIEECRAELWKDGTAPVKVYGQAR